MPTVTPPPEKQTGRAETRDRLRKLGVRLNGWRQKRRIPFVQQMTDTECGAACLTMVLNYQGCPVKLVEIREKLGIGRDAAAASSIVRLARTYNMRARGVKVDMKQLEFLPRGAILHWEFKHFVVFDSLSNDSIKIVDPAFGPRRVSLSQVEKSLTGVALVIQARDEVSRSEKPSRPGLSYVFGVITSIEGWGQIVAMSLVIQIFALAVPALTGVLVDRVIPRSDPHLLNILLIGLAATIVFHAVSSLLRAHQIVHLRTYVDAKMTFRFLDHLVKLPYVFFQQRSAGDLILRLNSNSTIREILSATVLSGLIDGILMLIYFGILFIVSPSIAIVVLCICIVHSTSFFLVRNKQRELLGRDLDRQAKAQAYQVEMFAGIETLKAMGGEQRAADRCSELYVDVLNVALMRGSLSATMEAVNSLVRIGAPILVLALGAQRVLAEEMTLGTMLAFNALALGVLIPFFNLVVAATELQRIGMLLERVEDVFESPAEQAEQAVRPAPRLQGRIELRGVSFSYSPATPNVVDSVSLTVEPGQFLAIVGSSGSGKSTLAKLMLGLYPPTAGSILYDGHDLARLDLRQVRQQMGIVTQHPYLFGTTVRANITINDPMIPLEQVRLAARKCCIHEDIEAMPMGYDTILIDGGGSLSGGQRQRIALARALVNAPRILMLDEATSALDSITERAVHKELKELKLTRVVIAHRLSTVADADVILVMEKGQLIEKGTHEELLAKQGAYARLVNTQGASQQLPAAPR